MSTPLEPVRAVQRALQLLRLLNEYEVCTLQLLQARTGLPKSTVHRLLATLQAEGYVYSGEQNHGEYRLTPTASNLSHGVTQKNRLAEVARPLLIAATKHAKWPIAMAVADGATVRVNVCTMPYSPYSMRPTCMGQQYALFGTALGSCYLAFCTAAERRILLDLDDQANGCRRWTPTSLHTLLRQTRARGYALRQGNRTHESTAFAVPIFDQDGQIAAALACSTFARTESAAWIERNLPVVQAVARDVSQRLTGLG